MATLTPQLNQELVTIKEESAPVIRMARELHIISPATFAHADSVLDQIVDRRKFWKLRVDKILGPLKEALDQTKGLFKEADGPLDQAEIIVRSKMRDYKLEESRLAREEEDKRYVAQQKLEAEADAKRLAESKAKTEAMRKRLADQRQELEAKAAQTAAVPMSMPVQVANSTTRTDYKPVASWPEVLKGLADGSVPLEAVSLFLNVLYIKRMHKAYPGTVATWSGITMVEDVQIVKR